jgi:hypothetical protein
MAIWLKYSWGQKLPCIGKAGNSMILKTLAAVKLDNQINAIYIRAN